MLVAQTIVAILVAYGVYGNVVREDSKTELRQKREPGKEHAAEVCGLKPSERLQLEKDGAEHKFDFHPEEMTEGLFQGDIELDEEQQKYIDNIRVTRDQIADEREVAGDKFIKLWPTGSVAIPLEIDPDFDADQRAKIKEAVDHIRKYTNCVIFKRKTSKDTSYIKFQKHAKKCSSQIGRKNSRPTVINLAPHCFHPDRLTIVHEMMHAFGFLHEQSRMDRDEYVEIDKSNIPKPTYKNFMKGSEFFKDQAYTGRVFGETYDFGSIMHYGLRASAIDRGKNTIKPKPAYKDEAKIAGQRRGLSDKDVRKIDRLFECPRKPKFDSCFEFKTMKERIQFWEHFQTSK